MAEQLKKDETKVLKHRSPAYPFISLPKALERAREFYRPQRQHPAPLSDAVGIWKFGKKSSGGAQTISALKQFGLMVENEISNTRQVKLTEAALRIIQDERPLSAEREALIKQLALLPKIYAEMWTKWGAGAAPDATAKFFLVNEKKYNEAAFSDLFSAYKDTIEFAKLAESDKNGGGEGEGGERTDPLDPPSPPPPPKGKLMEGERIVFTHEIEPTHGVRVLASGHVDHEMLDALDLYVELQRKRLARQELGGSSSNANDTTLSPPSADKPHQTVQRLGAVLITKANKVRLREKGYTDEQINKMKPEEALEILGI